MKLFLALLLLSLPLSAAEKTVKNLPYSESLTLGRQTLDLYLPASLTPAPPLIVFAHGGAWMSGNKKQYAPLAQGWVNQGVACALINYRLATTADNAHPAAAEDLASALAWLAKNAAKYRYDPKKIFVVGHSAGAHMAASIATTGWLLAKIPTEFQPAGYVGLAGIYDIPALLKRWPGYLDWFIDKAFGKNTEGWKAASPAQQKLVTKAPWLLVNSKTDDLVDDGQSFAFKKHLEGQGVKVEIEQPQNASHFEVVQNSPRILKFVAR